MITFLTFVKIHNPVETLDDILQSEYKIGTRKGTLENAMFENAKEGTIYPSI